MTSGLRSAGSNGPTRAGKAKAPGTGRAHATATDAKETSVPLKTYRQKRDFRQTTEPKGRRAAGRDQTVFVIHEHHASILHFDLWLAIDGVLKSWSVPKGPTLDPAVKRLAVEVEDHPLAYADFDGTIPEGQYGAGRSVIWDEGWVEIHAPNPLRAWEAGRLSFTLAGKKLRGAFALVRMQRRKGKPPWLLMKKNDADARRDWRLELVEPDTRFTPEPPGQQPAKVRRVSAALTDTHQEAQPRQGSAPTGIRVAKAISTATFRTRAPLGGTSPSKSAGIRSS